MSQDTMLRDDSCRGWLVKQGRYRQMELTYPAQPSRNPTLSTPTQKKTAACCQAAVFG